jgi:hypothetical protein
MNETEVRQKKWNNNASFWLINLLTEIRLNEKKGIHKTSVKIKDSEIRTVPMWVNDANWPLGNLIVLETTEFMDLNKEIVQIIWSVAPVSMIQGAWIEFVREVFWNKEDEDAKTECFVSKEETWKVTEILPAMWEMSWSWGEAEETWLTDAIWVIGGSREAGLNMFMSCWHCSYVIGSWG